MRNGAAWLPVLAVALIVAGCGTAPKRSVYYQDDGPPDRVPVDLATIPDATPKIEPINPRNSRPYVALGRGYTPLAGDVALRQRGLASWYGRQFHGNRTANGEIYDMFAMTAAHPTMPLPSYARVTSVRNGRSVIVRVNDRGPFQSGRVIDLSYAAAVKLGIAGAGTGEVEVERITFAEIASGAWRGSTAVAAAPAGNSNTSVPASAVVMVAAPPALIVTPEPAAQGQRWSIQLGAFSQQSNADAFAARIAALLAPADELSLLLRSPRIERTDGVFRVLVGELADRSAALAAAEHLERLLGQPTSLLAR